MTGFARGLRQDEAAVKAALSREWSNGQVEGQVNRLKFIKRSMYGRGGFELLRARSAPGGGLKNGEITDSLEGYNRFTKFMGEL